MKNSISSLRGFKGTLYEGGTKIPGFVHSPILDTRSKAKDTLDSCTWLMYTQQSCITNTKILGMLMD